ncbi:MAG: hypothetical protein ACK5OB_12970 [Pirellula sp.]
MNIANHWSKIRTYMEPKPGTARRRAIGSQIGLLILACGLWCMNWLPIQSSGYVVTTSAVVSQERWNALMELSHGGPLASDHIRWLTFRRARTADSPTQTGVAQVRMQLGISRPLSISKLESELDRLTRSSPPSPASAPAGKELRVLQWNLEVTQHQMQRFRLDREREGVDLAECDRTSPFRQASYSTRLPREASQPMKPDDRETWQHLVRREQQLNEAIAGLQSTAAEASSSSEGRIAFTGAPHLSAMAGRLSLSKIAAVLSLSSLLGLALLTLQAKWKSFRYAARGQEAVSPIESPVTAPKPSIRSRWTWPTHWLKPRIHFGRKATRATHSTVAEHVRSVSSDQTAGPANAARHVAAWARKLDIPYWGEAQWNSVGDDAVSTPECIAPSTSVASCETTDSMDAHFEERSEPSMDAASVSETSTPTRAKKRASLLTATGDGMLLIWVAVFTYRFACDSLWRDLLFRAPLAAFSNLFFGI